MRLMCLTTWLQCLRPSIMSEHVYHGPWVNWAHGTIRGATLTLSNRSGALLTAFIAFFVTLVGAQLFKILTYIFHQSRSRSSAQDGLFHQQQVVFRNSSSPGATAWTFLMQGWTWKGKTRMPLMRTIPWASFCLAYALLFAAAATFSSEITKTPGTSRLIIGETCGYWAANDNTNVESVQAFARYVANESLAAAAYARSCYGGSFDVLSCSKFLEPSLPLTANANAACPFTGDICSSGKNSAYELTSRVDSLYDLGINSPHGNRLQIERVSTCAPINQKGFVKSVAGGSGAGIDGDTLYQFNYGHSVFSGTDVVSQNYTLQYNDHTIMDMVGYKLSMETANAGSSNTWQPIPELSRTDADVTIIFLMQNAVTYSEPVDDPMFAATNVYDLSAVVAGAKYYGADNYVTTMACTDQYKVCNPNNDKCTPLGGINQILPWIGFNDAELDLDDIQEAIAIRLMRSAQTGSISQILFALAENALLAKDLLVGGLMSSGLPANQWQREVEGWLGKGLADYQRKIVEYATGPPNIGPGSYVEQPWKDDTSATAFATKAMCYSQMINDTTDTISFSILGMIILFVIGGTIVFISLFVDTVVGWIQKTCRIGEHARMCWLLDDKLQLHRFLNQELGHGSWSDDYEAMPYTTSHQLFQTLGVAHEKNISKGSTGQASPQPSVYQPPVYQNTAPSFPPSPMQTGSYTKYTQISTVEDNWMGKP
ncbi:hypothetical protein LTR05_001416 [Lithohypha guttulata]|uniref:Uncharacterized protein n=1 Tax=Lithohypha guttulata TaxID=1690604 RepID=A0AAN7T7Y1_9EURO|nr:hypothetical protein LTR05_001416 [Lithohypha guttulata]